MSGWVFWIIAAIVLAVGEMVTLSFFLAPFAGGALLAAIVDAAGGGVILSWGIFILVLAAAPARRAPHRPIAPQDARAAAHRHGRSHRAPAVVVERIANHEAVGAIRIDSGDVWTARTYDEDETYDVGTRVEVVEIKGATALVTD